MNAEMKVTMSETRLTEREMMIAREAAKIAVREMTDGFFKEVGRTVFSKFLILLGIAFVSFAIGKGWIGAGGIGK